MPLRRAARLQCIFFMQSKAKSAEITISSDEIHNPPSFSLADVVAWDSYGLIVVED